MTMGKVNGPDAAIESAQSIQDQTNKIMHLCHAANQALMNASGNDQDAESRNARLEAIDAAMVFSALARDMALDATCQSEALEELIVASSRSAGAIGA